MKTFRAFISEATIQELRAKARMLRQKGDIAAALEVEKQAGELQAGTQARISAELKQDQEKPKQKTSSWVSGGASKPKDTRGRRSGSLKDIPSSAGENPGTIASGRFGQTTTGRSGGVRGTLVNRGTSRTGTSLGRKA